MQALVPTILALPIIHRTTPSPSPDLVERFSSIAIADKMRGVNLPVSTDSTEGKFVASKLVSAREQANKLAEIPKSKYWQMFNLVVSHIDPELNKSRPSLR